MENQTRKSKFISDELTELTLADGSKIKVKGILSFQEYQGFLKGSDYGKNPLDGAPALLKASLKEWDFEGADGVLIPCDEANIDRLSGEAVIEILHLLLPLYTPEKKN